MFAVNVLWRVQQYATATSIDEPWRESFAFCAKPEVRLSESYPTWVHLPAVCTVRTYVIDGFVLLSCIWWFASAVCTVILYVIVVLFVVISSDGSLQRRFVSSLLLTWCRSAQWADEYFVIKHRGETRGLGGIFFDDQNDKGKWNIYFRYRSVLEFWYAYCC